MGSRLSYRFENTLLRGTVISRPNRFIMVVKSHDRVLQCHCPTTGRLGDVEPAGLPCLYSVASNEQRKTAYTVEAISTSCGRSWIGINQTAANRYIEFFLKNGSLARLLPEARTPRYRPQPGLPRTRVLKGGRRTWSFRRKICLLSGTSGATHIERARPEADSDTSSLPRSSLH